ncbi:hypothetical protein D3C86_1532730 [compost metagenome]
MYSYEDRIRAGELYIKLGKRVAEAIHQLGYPTENALKSWHRAYEQGSDLPRGYARTKPKYSQAQQTLAIEHSLVDGSDHMSHLLCESVSELTDSMKHRK